MIDDTFILKFRSFFESHIGYCAVAVTVLCHRKGANVDFTNRYRSVFFIILEKRFLSCYFPCLDLWLQAKLRVIKLTDKYLNLSGPFLFWLNSFGRSQSLGRQTCLEHLRQLLSCQLFCNDIPLSCFNRQGLSSLMVTLISWDMHLHRFFSRNVNACIFFKL